MSARRRREHPIKRTNPSGKQRWVARYTNLEGKEKSAGTFDHKGPCKEPDPVAAGPRRECCAQHAIDQAYLNEEAAPPAGVITIGEYATRVWPERYPRSKRTARSHKTRLKAAMAIPLEGRPLGGWAYPDLRPRHATDLVDHMLREEGRAAKGAAGILNSLSVLNKDAVRDEHTEINFVADVEVRANDPRVRKAPKKARVFTFDQLREFAAAGRAEVRRTTPKPERDKGNGETLYYPAIDYEPMLATITLAGPRVGEVFALLRTELDLEARMFFPTGTADEDGEITRGDTETKKHEGAIPIAPSLEEILRRMVVRIDTPLLFATPSGTVWLLPNFYRDVWAPAQIASGIDMTPHEARHSFVTNLRRAGIDPADLADATRHTVQTATNHYTHPTYSSYEEIRQAIG
jgi:integrase